MSKTSRLDTIQAAADALRELEIDQTRPVNPFRALDLLGLVVGFVKLNDLLGAIIPSPDQNTAPGVLLTTERQASVQRYTAAHEIGHWYLDQDFLHIDLPRDTAEEVLGTPSSERERNAQLFASHFLMPLPLIARTARKYGLRRSGYANPVQAYSIARDMNVSYSAAVVQLTNTGFISSANSQALSKVVPMTAKRELGGGRKPTTSRGEVWVPTEPRGTLDLEVSQGDDIVIRLPENRTTGYFWESDRVADSFKSGVTEPPQPVAGAQLSAPTTRSGSVAIVQDDFSVDTPTPSNPVVGSVGTRQFVLHAGTAGNWQRTFEYSSPFRPNMPAAEQVIVNVSVHRAPSDEFRLKLIREVALSEGPEAAT